MKAVILAAGMGIRLRPLTDEVPKAFIKIDEKSLIIRSLSNLNDLEINELTIVTGYLEDVFKRKIGNHYKNIDITYVSNPKYSNTGSMYSLSQTEGIIEDNILLLESDLLYEKRALQILLKSREPSEILVAPLSGSGDEVYICVNENNELVNLGKIISNNEVAIGELVGISKLSYKFLTELYKLAKIDYEKNRNDYHYEEVIFKLSKRIPIKCRLVNDLNWIEIDNNEDLIRAKEKVYPKIRRKEIFN